MLQTTQSAKFISGHLASDPALSDDRLSITEPNSAGVSKSAIEFDVLN